MTSPQRNPRKARRKSTRAPSARGKAAVPKAGRQGITAQTIVDQIGRGATARNYARRAIIFRQGDPANAVFFIRKGKVQITILSAQGKQGVIAMLTKGDFLGENCLAGQPTQIATAIAIEDAEIVRIDQNTMVRVLRKDPTLAQVFISHLLSRNMQVEADLVDQMFNSSEKRLARVLLLLANFGKEGKLEPVPKISQELLAMRVGTTRSRINYFMNKFRKLGLIDYNGTLLVHSGLLNVIVHD